MKKYIFFVLISTTIYSQDLQKNKNLDSLADIFSLEEVTVNALRAQKDTPVPFINISKKDLEKVNLAQDLPTLLKNTPSVLTTSDSGSGIGYSSIRVRGSDQSRVNVTINGIPYNDSESMSVYWVNLPDFASSIESIQIQRGVGTSTNGSAAFGGSINILTNAASENASFEINNSLGSFNTVKNSVGFSTGFINDKFELSGRLSRIKSSGYIDRSGSKLRSYFLQGIYKDENTLVKILSFAGHEITDQAWFGVDSSTLETNRKYNPAGEYYDKMGNTLYYNNQDDNYKQDHYQFHWNQSYKNGLKSNFGLHYTYGRGFFENYNLAYDSNSSDYIDRRWLDNKFYGMIFSLNQKTDNYNAIIGGSFNIYDGQHYGEYIWSSDSKISSNFKERFYDDIGDKREFNVYAKIDYYLSEKISIYGDLQFRNINYNASITPYSVISGYVEKGYEEIDKNFNFLNPKLGVFYNQNDSNKYYLSYARAQREPTRADYASGSPNPEKLDDFELGWRGQVNNLSLNLNVFYMLYDNQLVLTGERDINGYEIRTNIGKSYRLGLEVESKLFINSNLNIESNISLSENKNNNLFYSFDGELQNFGDTDLAYSPNLIVNNIINFSPNDKVYFSLISKYVSEQFFAQTNSPISKLDSYFINDLNFTHELSLPNYANELKLKVLVNNIFDVKYTSYGGYYTYDLPVDQRQKTYEGTYYYPQSGINILVGLDIKF
ncbi:MAG: TonB-dependent receptor [Flavobacteriales bacterium]|nr:TonB-dependent receptor [Flavobacteriales bacterium]